MILAQYEWVPGCLLKGIRKRAGIRRVMNSGLQPLAIIRLRITRWAFYSWASVNPSVRLTGTACSITGECRPVHCPVL